MRTYMRLSAVLLLVVGSVLALSAQTSWNGIAAQGGAADFPLQGQWALANNFPVGAVIQITNIAANRTINARVIGRSTDQNYFLVVSAEAARNLGISPQFPARVRATLVASSSIRNLENEDLSPTNEQFFQPPPAPAPAFSQPPPTPAPVLPPVAAPPPAVAPPVASSAPLAAAESAESRRELAQRGDAATPIRKADGEDLVPGVDFPTQAQMTPQSTHERIPINERGFSRRRTIATRGSDAAVAPPAAPVIPPPPPPPPPQPEEVRAVPIAPPATPVPPIPPAQAVPSRPTRTPNAIGSRLSAATDSDPRLAEPDTFRKTADPLTTKVPPSTPPAPSNLQPIPTPAPKEAPPVKEQAQAPVPSVPAIVPSPATSSQPQSTATNTQQTFRIVAADPRPAPITSLPQRTAAALDENAFYIQVGAFRNLRAAEEIVGQLQQRGYTTFIYNDDQRRRRFNRILVGPIPADETGSLLVWIRAQGFEDAFSRRGSAL